VRLEVKRVTNTLANMDHFNVACIVGARPNFIKMAALLHEIERRSGIDATLVHTGQHSTLEMSDCFFDQLEIPRPHVNLEVAGTTQISQMAEIMSRLEGVLGRLHPDVVIVVGDVTSTLAAALVAAKMLIPLAHVEAGLRSVDRTMPEEINRIATDHLSDYLFATEQSGVDNLLAEGHSPDRVFLVGNTMIDSLLRFKQQAQQSRILQDLGLTPREYAVATLHRPSNVDDPAHLREFVELFQEIAVQLPVVFAVHPRTRQRLPPLDGPGKVLLTPPLPYLEFLGLTSCARLVLTDSGGVQEETTVLGVPCLTMRENTERPSTVRVGTNRLVGTKAETILAAVAETLAISEVRGSLPELWDGQASSRIVDILEARLRQPLVSAT
jgi:UDP-N-acetylglucosamine 2-epimerase (non-hydrolysing)